MTTSRQKHVPMFKVDSHGPSWLPLHQPRRGSKIQQQGTVAHTDDGGEQMRDKLI